MLKFFWPLLTLNYYSQSFHILRQKMIISQVFLQQQNTPHFIVYFSENQKNKKKQKSSPRDKDEWCFDHKTLYLEKNKKKQKLYFGQLPQHLTTSWLHEKKVTHKWVIFEVFFFSSLCKSFTQSDSQNKTKIKPTLPPLSIEWMCSRRKVIVSDTSFERPFSFLYHFVTFFGTQ